MPSVLRPTLEPVLSAKYMVYEATSSATAGGASERLRSAAVLCNEQCCCLDAHHPHWLWHPTHVSVPPTELAVRSSFFKSDARLFLRLLEHRKI